MKSILFIIYVSIAHLLKFIIQFIIYFINIKIFYYFSSQNDNKIVKKHPKVTKIKFYLYIFVQNGWVTPHLKITF